MDTETLLKNTSRSLYLSVQVLPKAMRPAFSIAYLLCRYADTIADTAILPINRRLYWIERFKTLIIEQDSKQINQLVQEIDGASDNPYEKELIKRLYPCLEAFNRISDKQKPLILEVVQAVCEGMLLDLQYFPQEKEHHPKAFPSYKELEHYCRLMGGMPGLFWSKLIFTTTRIRMAEEKFYQLGQFIGDALQIVNILRDIPKDLRINRCYFPMEDLQKEGLREGDLLLASNSERFEPIKKKWIFWGVERLKSGKEYFRQLPKTQLGQRAAVAWPMLWTADSLYKLLSEKDLLNPHKRVKISRGVIYYTMLLTPFILISNTLFEKWLDRKLNKFYC
jgi:farnesyl-diphosphate farnesyltransferase